MAELIVTPEEEKAATYLEWDNESLGKLVKMIGLMLNDEYGKDAAWVTMAAHLLVDLSLKTNSTNTKVNISGCSKDDKPVGDWEIRIRKVNT